jgi:hypothetical protein
MVNDRLLDAEHLNAFRVLILPNIAALSEFQCRQIRQYVRSGGSLCATFETSLYDERGERRSDFGLADLFGVSRQDRVDGPMKNSYLRLRKDATTGEYSPILRGLEDAHRIVNGIWRLNVRPRLEFPSPVTLIPSYPDLPMEHVYPRQPDTDIRELYLRRIGEGRIAYIPWDIDRTFWEILNADHGRLLRNVIEWAMNEEQPVQVNGPGILDVTVWRQQQSMTVHLVNLTNPMMMKGPFREIIPLPAQQVRIRIPDGVKVKRVHCLVAGTGLDHEIAERWVVCRLPSISDHEVIALDLSSQPR